jgi:hypothetical protein
MESQENWAKKLGATPPKSKDTTRHIDPKSKTEPMTQVQADNVLTREQVPNVWFRSGVSLVLLVLLLFVAALYYGIINP